MSSTFRISDDLVRDARKQSRIDHRSLAGQIEYWARIGKAAEENPDFTLALIMETLVGSKKMDVGDKSDYRFG